MRSLCYHTDCPEQIVEGNGLEVPRLKEWRLRRAMAQRDLAAASGVGTATIARLERGHHMARPSTVRRLVEALAIRPHDLMAEPSPAMSRKEGK